MEYALRHHGIITHVGHRKLSVKIASDTDCAGCAVKSICNPVKKKSGSVVIEASIPDDTPTEKFNVGEKVSIAITTSGRMRAVGLSVAVPCLLLLLCTLSAIGLGMSQPTAAASGLTAVMAYYLILYLLRRHIFANPRWIVTE
ncbi:SoxR reducing system RseC family protein [uncultured Muribaculum sp.]|uniref:SoxR reducing system RseC family protein n=1 Tax=uncultured Muribaculum sp. TaxID=1918613 RepID=UPI0025DA513C|nr:SoxR reducing system RseC family protein [uncultured Muribaculum sp.]